MKIKIYSLLTFLVLNCLVVIAKNPVGTNKKIADTSMKILLREIDPKLTTLMNEVYQQSKRQIQFCYTNSEVNTHQRIPLSAKYLSIGMIMLHIESSSPLTVQIMDHRIILRKKKSPADLTLEEVGQYQSFSGEVVDEDGIPIAGVSINEMGNNKPPHVSGPDGRFLFRSASKSVLLEFSRKGFIITRLRIRNSNGTKVQMKHSYNELEEAVVMGYTTILRKYNTASVFSIKSDDLPRGFGNNIASSLQSKVPGLLITDMNGAPGGGSGIQIRGRQSIGMFPGPQNFVSNTPLILVNGVVWTTPSRRISSLGTDPTIKGLPEGVVLNGLNIEDIESIIVYKDADATAIFGNRGANGVISICTKKGEAGDTISYSLIAEHGQASSAFIPRYMNTSQYAEMKREILDQGGLPVNADTAPELFQWPVTTNTNWPQYTLGNTARMQRYHVSASGGVGKQFRFYSSAGWQEETSVLPAKFSNRAGTIHLNASFRPGRRSHTEFSMSLSSVRYQQPATDPMPYIRLAPNAPALRDVNGSLVFAEKGLPFGNVEAQLLNTYESKTFNVISSLNTEYALTRRLFFKLRLGLNTVQLNEKAIYPLASIAVKDTATGAVETAASNSQSWSIEPQLQYLDTNRSNQRSISLLIGGTFQDQSSNWEQIHLRGYKNDAFLDLPEAAAKVTRKDDASIYRYAGLYGGANLTLKRQYVFNVTGRYDGSSRFGPDHRFALFGALGTAWVFTNAKWFQNSSSFLSFGKLRASVGTTGNDQSGNYSYKDSYHLITDGSSYANVSPIKPTGLSNPGLSWERNLKKEIAIELQTKSGISMSLA
ncbi:MAG: SusC/RagA family TonB-linked outer membrane protein, partial [Chitinophagaceae bacterium]|nr:SusC/RagA family TonB-linked outer membrane protein [Chitinophagaceae bacterium]